ncbi:RNA polymerase sigma factor SigJ [Actinotalea solisilvae]|uniref:RNA polymerase sigma factor SigJ n=1 Tax=Actinotalea solisilvae TaxID=2072922 RepID=UPI0027DBF63B|nr:RNA polymerase sigma factor SigJ [Actinotalea solisilvae]
MDRTALLSLLADGVEDARALLVGVDGADGAGKTVLADELAAVLRERGRPVVRVSLDGFHQPRAVRYRRGRSSPEGFVLDSYDVERFVTDVVEGARERRSVRPAAFDHRTDAHVTAAAVPLGPGAVVLVDGMFLHRDELAEVWDLSVYLQARSAVRFARMAVRDGSPADPGHPANARYLEGQRLYRRTCDPLARADVVVDHDDPAHPVVLRSGGGTRRRARLVEQAGDGAAPAALAAELERERPRLVGLAYRMLGSRQDAEDAVQDAWLRLARADRSAIADLPAWLTTVTSRLCLDRLRAVRAERARYVGPWLPEPLVVRVPDGRPGPAERAETDESVRMALLVVLEQLTPEQRVAFVLHDVFAVPFDEVAGVLGTTPGNARQLASRARQAVREAAPEPAVPVAEQRTVVEAFVRAALEGDLPGLVAVLAPDVVLRSDGGGLVHAALRPVLGADHVARFVLGIRDRAGDGEVRVVPALVNGEVGAVLHLVAGAGTRTDAGTTVVVPRVGADGRIQGLDLVRNPDKLTRVPV